MPGKTSRSDNHKRVVTLHRRGKRHAEIVDALGISYSRVTQILHKARISGELPAFERQPIADPGRLAATMHFRVGNFGTQLRQIDMDTMEAIFGDAINLGYENVAEYCIDLAVDRNKTGGKNDG